MLRFKIDQNDLSIVDGGCVDDTLKTLKTSSVRVDYSSKLADASKIKEIVLHIHDDQDDELFDVAFYVMCGTIIDTLNNIMNVSFGGLRGEFKLNDEQYKIALSTKGPDTIYLYFL